MATPAPLPANSLLALAELLSLGPEDGDEDSADAVRSAPGVVAGGGAPWPFCLNRPVFLRRRKAPRAAAPGRGVSVPGRLAVPRVSRRGREGGARLPLACPSSPGGRGSVAHSHVSSRSRPAAARGRQGHLERRGGARRVRGRRLVGPPGAARVRSRAAGGEAAVFPSAAVPQGGGAVPASLPSIAFLSEPGEGKPAGPEPARPKPGRVQLGQAFPLFAALPACSLGLGVAVMGRISRGFLYVRKKHRLL